MNELKEFYNYNLKRFNNGCKYCEEHKDEIDKWLPELFKIYKNMNDTLDEIAKCQEITSKEIIEGFKIETIRK